MYDVLQPEHFFVNYNRADTKYGRQKILIIITILRVSSRRAFLISSFLGSSPLRILPTAGVDTAPNHSAIKM